MVINNTVEIGEIVYLKTDPDQQPGIVISIRIFAKGEYMYEINKGAISSLHYDFELSVEKNILISA